MSFIDDQDSRTEVDESVSIHTNSHSKSRVVHYKRDNGNITGRQFCQRALSGITDM